jgi:RNA polymerase sigma-70 factor (ECF subfamily)
VKDLLLESNKEPGVCREELVAMQECRRGSRKAFEVLVNKYMRDAYFIALGFVGNREDAQDLSQEAFVRAYRNIKKIRPESGFFPWFYQILKNLCISHLRKRKHRRTQSLDVEGCPEAEAPNDNFSPNEIAERNENKDRVWQAIGKLDPKHREVIILRHFQNMSYEQIAEALFCNKGTVTSRLYYARKHLEELLKARDSSNVSRASSPREHGQDGHASTYETSGEKGGLPDDMP